MSEVGNRSDSLPFRLMILIISFDDCLVKMSSHRGRAVSVIST